MENKSMALLIGAFVALIIGVSLVGVIATQEQLVSTHTAVSEETFELDEVGTGGFLRYANDTVMPNETYYVTYGYDTTSVAWKTNYADCAMATPLFVGNATGLAGAVAGTLTETTDFVWTDDGKISFVASAEVAAMGNTTYISYSYCPDTYLTQGWTRSVSNLVPGFFAIALLLISVGLFYQVMKNEGLLGM